jgi:hypothetical protein
MKSKILIAALLGVGVLMSASAQQTVYLTGSTAYRSVIFGVCTTPGQVFASKAGVAPHGGAPADPVILSPAPNNTSGANTVVFEGYIYNSVTTLYDYYVLNCSFTGSEAGIAAVAGVTIANGNVTKGWNYENNGGGGSADLVIPQPPGVAGADSQAGTPAALFAKTLPGAPVYFLDPNANPAYSALMAAPTLPDLSMADTSQAVSLTQSAALTDFGIVGIVPFTWAKCKDSAGAPSSSWSDLVNVANAQLLSFLASGHKVAAFFTGHEADSATVYLVGRNIGSGTHVNAMLTPYYYPKVPIQYAVESYYGTVAARPSDYGVLTFAGAVKDVLLQSDIKLTPNGTDGYDSGGYVAKALSCDVKNIDANTVLIGYVGISDYKTALGNGAVGLTLDGVPENDGTVTQGAYSFWGHEHLLGQTTPSAQADEVANSLVANIPSGLTAVLVDANQSTGIATSIMAADKNGDMGYPSR